MTCNNQGIMHAAFSRGGHPLCKNRNAHMSTDITRFRDEPKPCKRCAAKVAKMDALAAKKAAKAVHPYAASNYMTNERRTFASIPEACEFMGGDAALCTQVLTEGGGWFERGPWLCSQAALLK